MYLMTWAMGVRVSRRHLHNFSFDRHLLLKAVIRNEVYVKVKILSASFTGSPFGIRYDVHNASVPSTV